MYWNENHLDELSWKQTIVELGCTGQLSFNWQYYMYKQQR